jgi:hypothetical protein
MKGKIMKGLNHHILTVAAAAFGAALLAQADEPPAIEKPQKNAALLASPRYLEEHPEVLRGGTAGGPSPALKRNWPAKLTTNAALVNSPRFREEHPELVWAASPAEERQAISESDRLRKLTENKALAASPRFREEHPELSRGGPAFEIAPLK